jgi:hypothetical protein
MACDGDALAAKIAVVKAVLARIPAIRRSQARVVVILRMNPRLVVAVKRRGTGRYAQAGTTRRVNRNVAPTT